MGSVQDWTKLFGGCGFRRSVAAADSEPVSAAGDRQERVLSTRDGIVTSWVSFALPLPDFAPARPAACDRVGFMRYRPAAAPPTRSMPRMW
ncbi:hypothetical protein GFY24_25335 [Nocardia sp. SYP-A9097]|uniref:hypothetical protein n=1 Tax=Nocardia sp. SYP-A9097 TaxID=2663237 RepID=UPI00129B8532|nr:hypothetical protein [Nocardia sp. SYP-A9097]MRH90721.1 hypothetical protein [Nocardia sp. SYP-A9097]